MEILRAFGDLAGTSFLAALFVVGMCCALFDHRTMVFPKPVKVFYITFMSVGVVCCILLVISDVHNALDRHAIVDIMTECQPEETTVKFNGVPVKNPAVVLSETVLMFPPINHHSGPRESVVVEINCGQQEVIFLLRQDSRFADEFWVYWDGPHNPTRKIGNVKAPSVQKWLEAESKAVDNN